MIVVLNVDSDIKCLWVGIRRGSPQYGQLALAAARPPEFGTPDPVPFAIGRASPGVSPNSP